MSDAASPPWRVQAWRVSGLAILVLSVSLSTVTFAVEHSDGTKDLRSFERSLRHNNAVLEGCVAGYGPSGRGVFAQRAFQEGEIVLQIPRGLCLQTPLQLILLNDDEGTATTLAQKLLEERERGSSSPFYEYLQLLPPLPPLHPLDGAWSAHSPQKLRGSLRKRYVEAQHRYDLTGSQDFRWALGMVWTRAFTFGSSLAMVPYLDLFNHWIPQRREDLLWNCRLQEFTSCDAIGLVADRDIAKGEELHHLYSEASDAQLLVQHGIPPKTPSANPFNEAVLEVELPSEDIKLNEARTSALKILGIETLDFQLPHKFQELQSLAAILVLNLQELKAWLDAPGRIRLTAGQREQQRQLLRQWLYSGERELRNVETLDSNSALNEAMKNIIMEEVKLLRRLQVEMERKVTSIL